MSQILGGSNRGGGGGGDVSSTGPSTANDVAVFADNTGKLITDSGISSNNIPTTDEAAALAGTDGTPSATNKYVTNSDPRLAGSSINTGIAVLDFGSSASNLCDAVTVVTGQTNITVTSKIFVDIRVEATTDHSLEEVQYDAIWVKTGNIVPGSSFTIYGGTDDGTTYGLFNTSWSWSN